MVYVSNLNIKGKKAHPHCTYTYRNKQVGPIGIVNEEKNSGWPPLHTVNHHWVLFHGIMIIPWGSTVAVTVGVFVLPGLVPMVLYLYTVTLITRSHSVVPSFICSHGKYCSLLGLIPCYRPYSHPLISDCVSPLGLIS
jgi:hypothetical protein